jgi:alpha-1,2-mannosyltransferase
MLWHQLGEVGLAVTLVGVAGLLASPVSWLHHFVWVVPLALCLLWPTPGYPNRRRLPSGMLIMGWLFVGWVVAQLPMVSAPLRRLPNGNDLEWQWTWDQHATASVTAVLGLALLIASVVVARQQLILALERPAIPAGESYVATPVH